MKPSLIFPVLFLVLTFFTWISTIHAAPALKDKNVRDGVSVELLPANQTVTVGSDLQFRYVYSFKRSGRYMNVFALTHNHPFPSAEIRIFKEDGAFFTTIVASGFAGNFPNHEYLMYEDSFLGGSSTLSLKDIPIGKYKTQLVTYDKFWLVSWAQKERPAEAVLFSNIVSFEMKKK